MNLIIYVQGPSNEWSLGCVNPRGSQEAISRSLGTTPLLVPVLLGNKITIITRPSARQPILCRSCSTTRPSCARGHGGVPATLIRLWPAIIASEARPSITMMGMKNLVITVIIMSDRWLWILAAITPAGPGITLLMECKNMDRVGWRCVAKKKYAMKPSLPVDPGLYSLVDAPGGTSSDCARKFSSDRCQCKQELISCVPEDGKLSAQIVIESPL